MTEAQQINIAIAKSVGWTLSPSTDNGFGVAEPESWLNEETGELAWTVPDYCNDLNAMHEVEKTLNEKQTVFYMQRLSQIRWKAGVRGTIGTMLDRMVFATAQERAEAYLRTIGKWKE